jgi:acyl carrier protein
MAIRDDVTGAIERVLAKEFGPEAARISVDADYVSAIGLDSLDLLVLTHSIRKETGILLRAEELQAAKTVRILSEILRSRRSEIPARAPNPACDQEAPGAASPLSSSRVESSRGMG